jgi:hypothetical protein
MIQHDATPFLECSSRENRRFSAFAARIRGRGNRSIEDIYQAAKVFADGSTGLSWRDAKGKRAVNADAVRALYSVHWDEYIAENPHLLAVLTAASGVQDLLEQAGHACQATEFWRIRCADLMK